MSRRAWAYLYGILITGALLAGLTLPVPRQSQSDWVVFAAFTLLATLAQLFKVEAPKHQTYFVTRTFQFAGLMLFHPFLFILLVVIAHVVEWVKERLTDSPLLRDWYIQPFNIATHIIAGLSAHWVYGALSTETAGMLSVSSELAAIAAGLTYVFVNHLIVGQVLVLARGVSWRESGILEVENLGSDLVLLLLGYIVAVLWSLNPWLVPLALSPLLLMYRALMVPQLETEAQTDAKTGLWNAKHFGELFAAEMKRTKRFGRPLAVIMADLDLLRNINSTYGHLAGDAVLAGIGEIIRDTTREYDIAGRFGGEEFIIALLETEAAEAWSIAERLRQAVENARFDVDTSPKPIQATMSLGVACFPADAADSEELIHEADVAVYQAKLRGRNQVVLASDVPHSILLDEATIQDRLKVPYMAAYQPRPRIEEETEAAEPTSDGRADGATPSSVSAEASRGDREKSDAKPQPASPRMSLWLFVGSVIAAAILTSVLGIVEASLRTDLLAIALFALLTALAEAYQVNLYDEGSVSVSSAINFASAVVVGIPGVIVVSAVSALIRRALARHALWKAAFNWAVHTLAGSIVALGMKATGIPLEPQSIVVLTIPATLAAIAFFMLESGLAAVAIGLSAGTEITDTWRRNYRWLVGHYLVLSYMGLLLGMAYGAYGILGVAVFALPLFVVRYAQKQYVDRTKDSVRELKRMNEELTQANREVVEASKSICAMNEELLSTLAKISDVRDPYVHGHATKVSEYAAAIAAELGLPPERVEGVRQAGFLHDIGKVVLSEEVLHKPETLTDEEYEYVKSHAVVGADLLETTQGLQHLAPFVRHHHERWDGGGYPNGLAKATIPVEARILAVCDAAEAMASDRPYQRAMSKEEIIAELERCAGAQFDPSVVEAFVSVSKQKADDFFVNTAREVALEHLDDDDLLYHYSNRWFQLDSDELPETTPESETSNGTESE